MTILEKIGITGQIVNRWRERGLKITYPVKPNNLEFRSDDGGFTIENADKFVPPLTEEETKIYTAHPLRFKRDLLKNTKFFRQFADFIYKAESRLSKLEGKERLMATLSLLYLFQRSMDYHYYHWDRYLVYQNYPQTPVGFWWQELRNIYFKYDKTPVLNNKIPHDFLKLLARDKDVLNKLKEKISKPDFLRLREVLKMIRIFEDAQQKEVMFMTDPKSKVVNVLMRTGIPLLDTIWQCFDKYPQLIKNKKEIQKIKKLHPIIVGRKFTLDHTWNHLEDEIKVRIKEEIKRWI